MCADPSLGDIFMAHPWPMSIMFAVIALAVAAVFIVIVM